MNFAELEKKLDYVFSDKGLLKLACTHRSYSSENNERMEFLGDVVLSMLLSEYLYEQEEQLAEGDLTRRRAMLVRGQALLDIANRLDLGSHLYLGESEIAAGRKSTSILEDAVEALIAAVYLDGGKEAAERLVFKLWREKLQEKIESVEKDAKTQLQEWLQARGLPLPIYKAEVFGPGHHQTFKSTCRVVGIKKEFQGKGSTKRAAEQDAARKMQEHLEKS